MTITTAIDGGPGISSRYGAIPIRKGHTNSGREMTPSVQAAMRIPRRLHGREPDKGAFTRPSCGTGATTSALCGGQA
jgi:hypothetical protein